MSIRTDSIEAIAHYLWPIRIFEPTKGAETERIVKLDLQPERMLEDAFVRLEGVRS